MADSRRIRRATIRIRVIASPIVLMLWVSCAWVLLPSEAELTETFFENRTDFLVLKDMLTEDVHIRRLSDENVFYSEDDDEPIHEERIVLYRQILEGVGVEDGIHRDNPSSVRFIAASSGLPPTSSKSFLYTTEIPQPLVESIDKFVPHRQQTPVFKKLEDNWYLMYESW